MRDFKRGLSGDDFDDRDDDRHRDAETAAIPPAAPVQAAPPPPPAPEPATPAPAPAPAPTAHEGEIVDEPTDVHAPR
jgi:hypothetical protein